MELARGMGKPCGIDITIVQTGWGESLVSEPESPPLRLFFRTSSDSCSCCWHPWGGCQCLLDRAGTPAGEDADAELLRMGAASCWDSGKVGAGAADGHFHGCMTNTHTIGSRPRQVELLSNALLSDNTPAGLMTRLVDGVPHVDGNWDLSGLTVGDVSGWAPTEDGIDAAVNKCTGARYSPAAVMASPNESPDDAALNMLLDGTVDAG
jgi:hypothetical protein